MTPQLAVVATGLIVLVLIGCMRWPKRFGCFYFLFRPLIQPFAYNQYKLVSEVPITGIFPIILISYIFILTLFARQKTFFTRNSIYLYAMLFFLVLSAFFSIHFISTISWSLKYLTGFMMLILIYNNISSEQDFMMLIKTIVFCSIVPMAFGYYQYLTGTGHAWKGEYYKGTRIDSFLGEYNAYGEFLSLAIFAAIIWISKTKKKIHRSLLMVTLFSLFFSLLLSLNRGSWIALVFGIGVASAFFYKYIKVKWLIFGLIAVSLAGGSIIAERFQELDVKTEYGSKNTLEGRVKHWQVIWDLVEKRPFLGYGAGTAGMVLESQSGSPAAPPHSDYLLLWFECGIFCAMAYFLFLVTTGFFFLTRRNNFIMINYAMAAACFYFILISFFQNIIMNVTVFPMFLALLGAGLKLNSLAASHTHQGNYQNETAFPPSLC